MKALLVTLAALLETIYVSASPLSANVDSRAKVICGQAGYDAGTESFWGQSGVKEAFCSSQCTQQNCKSFAYGQGDCQLYDVAARSNFVAVGDSPYLFYDSGCVSSTTSTFSTTSIAGTTKTSTTSTKLITTSITKTTTTTASRTTTVTTTSAKNVASTTKATSTTTTSATSQICGKQGYITGADEFYYSDFVVIDGCKNACAEFNCTSFAYGAGECHLYNVSVDSNFAASDDSWYNLYDSSCFNTTYTPPIDPSQVCGTPCFFPDDGHVLHYFTTNFGSPTQEAFDDCYQKCVTYDDGYCDGWFWDRGVCELWRIQPIPDDLRWHPMKSNYCWARDCGAPNVNGGSSTSTSTTTSKTTVPSTKLASTTTAKWTSSSSSTKVVITTSSRTSNLFSTTTTTKAVTTKTSTKPPASPSTTTTTTKSPATTSSSTLKTSAQTISKATTVSTTTKPLATTTSTASGSSFICGQQGYFSGSSGFHGYSTEFEQPTQQALTQCYQYCVNSNEGYCAGWTWSSNSCVLFSYAPEGSHFQASSDSGMYVWDRNCGAPVATYGAGATMTTTTTKTNAKTSSTSSQKLSSTSSSRSTSTIR